MKTGLFQYLATTEFRYRQYQDVKNGSLSSRNSQSRRERGMRTQGYNVASSLLQSKGHGNRGRKGNQASLRIREGSPEGEGFRLQLNRKGFSWEEELETVAGGVVLQERAGACTSVLACPVSTPASPS